MRLSREELCGDCRVLTLACVLSTLFVMYLARSAGAYRQVMSIEHVLSKDVVETIAIKELSYEYVYFFLRLIPCV